MSKQKIFNFNFNQFDDYSNFYVNKTNFEAYNAIIKNNDQKIYLYGPNKSGKSFLGKIWCKKYNGIKYNNNFEKIININKNILIDNINNKINQEEIFHIINHCSLNNLYILITSNLLINEINFKLNDLNSRLKIFTFLKINKPDDDMLLNILTKLFIQKQFVINSKDIFQFILKNTNRTYENIINIVNKLDTLSIEKKRQLTIPLIKEIL
ncbi:MAG: HdaA/DnaA family protein [Alphaproteobacteria bacterium]